MKKRERILIVDTLRGFALLLIVLIHFVEHFDFFRQPEVRFLFSQEIDSKVMEMAFLLISGKAYTIFALLFGLSFFIQLDGKEQNGVDFRRGFVWRLTLLFFFGTIHSFLYQGDILHIYAILGLPLVFLYKVNTKALLVVAFLLIIQIPFIFQIAQSFIDPDYKFVPTFRGFGKEGNEVFGSGGLTDLMSYNLWKGKATVWSWSYNVGRLYQLFALFIIGMIIGRLRVFEKIKEYRKHVLKALFICITVFFVLYIIQMGVDGSDFSGMQKRLLRKLLVSYSNLAITGFLISTITLLYLRFNNAYIFKLFASYGKMSLSNYLSQAFFGVFFFYGFGFAMHRYLGSTWSLILGTLVFYTQAIICNYWNKRYYYGPLEWLWRCLTYFDFTIKFKRENDEELLVEPVRMISKN